MYILLVDVDGNDNNPGGLRRKQSAIWLRHSQGWTLGKIGRGKSLENNEKKEYLTTKQSKMASDLVICRWPYLIMLSNV